MNQPVDHQCVAQKNWMLLAIGLFAVWILAALATRFCLYADGAHEFLRVLMARDFVPLWWSRHFSYDIYQFPLVVVIKLGMTSLPLLCFAYGLGCFLPWPLALVLCCWISRENFWLAVVGCAAGYLNGAYMPVGQHCVAHAMFWPALFVLLFARPLKAGAALVLLVMAIGLQYAYESQVFLCSALLFLALMRCVSERREGHNGAALVFFVAAGLFFTSILNGVFSLLMPEIPVQLADFKNRTWGMLLHPGWTVGWTLVWGVAAIAAVISEKVRNVFGSRSGFILSVTVVLIWGSWPLLAPYQVDTGVQYDHRVMNLLVPLALLPIGLILSFRPTWFSRFRPQFVRFAAALLIAQSLWHLSCAALWYRDVVVMRTILAAKQGIVPLHNTVLAADGMLGRDLHDNFVGGRFDWSWPSLSIALAPQKQINCLICSEEFMDPVIRQRCWQPFDPFRPETLPHLEHYGIHFTNYIAALQKQTGIEATSPP